MTNKTAAYLNTVAALALTSIPMQNENTPDPNPAFASDYSLDQKLSDKQVNKILEGTREAREQYNREHPIVKKASGNSKTGNSKKAPKIQYVKGGIIKDGVFIPKTTPAQQAQFFYDWQSNTVTRVEHGKETLVNLETEIIKLND